jgi:hypothetical protein
MEGGCPSVQPHVCISRITEQISINFGTGGSTLQVAKQILVGIFMKLECLKKYNGDRLCYDIPAI